MGSIRSDGTYGEWRTPWIALITDPFVPARAFRSTEELRRARLAVLFCGLSVVQAPIFACVYFSVDLPAPAYGVLVAGALCLFTPWVLRTYSATVAHHYVMTLLFAALVEIASFTGGLFAPAQWWVAIIPMMAMVSAGKRAAFAWFVITSASVFIFAALEAGGVSLEPIVDHAKLGRVTLVAMAGFGAVLFAIASSYETRHERMVRSLEAALEETNRAERELRHAQKLEAIGRLASGVAHEINTPLQYVSSSIHFVEEATTDLMAMCEGDRAKDDKSVEFFRSNLPDALRMMTEGLGRVSDIVASLRELAHPSTARTRVDVNHIIEAALTLSKHEYKYVADVKTDLATIPSVDANGGEINQVLLNLIVNAAHAIAARNDGSRGTIRVSTVADPTSVTIAVADNGVGVEEAIEDKLYDPFFTTKPVGQGTGQGLAIVRTIVAAHAGSISFTSKAGEGTTFFVRLPISEPSEEAA